MALRDSRSQMLGADEIREIAHEIGITDDDLELAERAAEAHFVRGSTYAAKGLANDAIEELTDAVALDPGRTDAMHALARAHISRSEAEHESSDLDAADRYARAVLQLDPDHVGAHEARRETHAIRRRARARGRMLVAAAVAGAAVVGVAVFVAQDREAPAQPAKAASAEAPKLAPPPPPDDEDPPALAPVDAPECPRGMAYEDGRGCFVPEVVITPGEGLRELTPGVATPQAVLAAFGDDAKVSRHEGGDVYMISYDYDGSGSYEPDRRENRARPAGFAFERGILKEIRIGVYQKAIRTPGGLNTTGSTMADMVRELGKGYELRKGEKLDQYRYDPHGIEVWVDRADGRVTSFKILEKRP